jgi:general nucleoside transport system ATP-binding protein
MTTDALPIIGFEGISKRYDNGTQALAGVSFSIASGAIHAICGENGAGKSTLMKILFGLEQPTSGTIRLDGAAVSIASPRAAAALGIAMVHQHFSLIPSLTVAENILLGQEPRRGLLIDKAEARRRVDALSKRYNLDIEPDARVTTLSVAAQQKVEILKALSRDTVRVLILDEPTAVLTPPETDELFQRLRDLQKAGLTILFISHKLREVRALSSHVTALRLGQVSGGNAMDAIADSEIAALVMGASRPAPVARDRHAPGAVSIETKGLHLTASSGADRLTGVDITIRSGEILGLAGVDGSGQRGLVCADGRPAADIGRHHLEWPPGHEPRHRAVASGRHGPSPCGPVPPGRSPYPVGSGKRARRRASAAAIRARHAAADEGNAPAGRGLHR